MKRSALLLAILVLAPLLPLAEAAGPEARPWTAYGTGADVAAVAMAREGTTIVASLRAPPVQAPTIPDPTNPPSPDPSLPRTDVAVLDYGYGFATNFTVHESAPNGRTHVAVSRDGTAIASLRREFAPLGSTQSQSIVQLHFARIAPGGNWSAGPTFERTVNLGPLTTTTPIGVAISESGHRVVALTRLDMNYSLRGFSASGTSLDAAFDIRGPGVPRALATSGDLARSVVAGQFTQGNFTYGGAYVLQFAQAVPVASFFDASANNTDVRSAAMSRDGTKIALGGADGQLHLFSNARDSLATRGNLTLGAAPLSNLTISEDGTRVASAAGLNVALVDSSGQTPASIWNATVSGQNVTGLALNATGGLLVVGTSGSGGGVYGYSDVASTLLWSIPGDTRGVALDADGTRVAYGQRASIGAARIPRAFTMDLVGGGKVAPTQEVTVPGSASVEVSLRNDGAALERIVFEESAPEIDVVSSPAIVTVAPGEIVRANLTLNVSAGLVGQRVFNVTARSITSGGVDNVTLSVVPRPTLDVKLQINTTAILAQPGEPSEVLVTVVNNGTGDAPVALRAEQTVSSGPLWNLTPTETTLTALAGTRSSVRVIVTPPADAANGTAALVTLTLVGQDVFDTKTISLRINPELKVEVVAVGSVTKFIEPGKRAFYNVTVTNIGSLPREFDVFYTIVSSDNRNWGIDMPTELVRLDPLAVRTFPVTIVAPADALPQERVAVLVSARSVPELPNETVVEENVTLFGIAIEPKITTTTPNNGIPYMTPLAVVATIILIALFAPRGRRQ